ncbi:MAG: bifunctional diaminohydroxyphosphoribosylaminopyrimidine deaminase/5-amino-6-(5-phosphoribosylamino)uracil reductase RibD [Bacteroides sp.]|nr:bifunctional diaminohydroxyphosphoribosylaminopyrimidine deaminase/5-amino-6-(5-phosphoribosylamino)uracil reductase RibD [Ruminococcus flavefaciens]MCM1555581.1 bifunctional diaminohydroxyphosphoribosylaminopyrimidine deaminase/5-amino-6-(5-phosphoribosylamino)uracil reductase RibD [Bacteroides sp.]
MQSEQAFMRRAFEVARHGLGATSPNPTVGCVVVWQNRIIGEGFHRRYGEAHAEVNAVQSILTPNATVAEICRTTGKHPEELLRESTMYVSLEPCSHYGKQPPCALKIIEMGVPRVVVSCPDPNPEVNGKGIAMLREAGVEVREHCLEAEGWEMGRRFFTNVQKKRPYVILKWAQSADGFIAAQKGLRSRITGPVLQALNHAYRVREDAIMVGTNTILADNPRLDARMYHGSQPLRVSFDLHGRLLTHMRDAERDSTLPQLHFFDGRQKSLLFVNKDDGEKYAGLQTAAGQNLEICPIEAPFRLQACLEVLKGKKIGSLIVEGGTELLHSFIAESLWDEIRVFRGVTNLGNGYPAPALPPAECVSHEVYNGEEVDIYRNRAADSRLK